MRESWRWFGPNDAITIEDVRQTGVPAIVSAMHHLRPGELWTPEEIARRQAEIRAAGMEWEVVESLPVSEAIKRQTGPWREHIATYCESLHNLAAAGIEVICYNFMPVLDWTRTDLAWPLPSGATCMRFDHLDFAAFDLHILARPGAHYPDDIAAAARERAEELGEEGQARLTRAILFGLPGEPEGLSLEKLQTELDAYADLGAEGLRAHLIAFLEEVVPVAERLGLRMCCHPDDPPFGLLGLPRVMSTEADYTAVLEAVDSPASGMTLCSGSLGARGDNDLPAIMRRWGHRVPFIHLRNVARDGTELPGSFHESGHLTGDVDMLALIEAILAEEARRHEAGRTDWNIPFRPDHGLDMSDDARRRAQPGYPLVGRHVGLAELRGAIAAMSR
ncbi:mannonate dehydratase [Pseudoroseicyclus tamaricis]|uniref:Mannonate dehydratase n=1 Tax=Pseudoroseicyclus tamaricis TaxID=2705421 RepID=A0A6B2JVM2_9RHOB|nr:mannonate dehydratase [Pseudoroseicyclus tamaricis]NDV00689.1 mannonate dehydratase [Pseudoroseicyclus tamaricis]